MGAKVLPHIANALGKPLSDLLLRGRFASIWWPRIGLEVARWIVDPLDGTTNYAHAFPAFAVSIAVSPRP